MGVLAGEVRQVKLNLRLACTRQKRQKCKFHFRNKMALFSFFSYPLNVFFFLAQLIDGNTMLIFELFCGFINAFVSFRQFLPTRRINKNLFLDACLRYAKGHARLTLKAAMGNRGRPFNF